MLSNNQWNRCKNIFGEKFNWRNKYYPSTFFLSFSLWKTNFVFAVMLLLTIKLPYAIEIQHVLPHDIYIYILNIG